MNFPAEVIANLERALAMGGTDGILVRSSDPGYTPSAVRFLLRHPGPRDDAIVNAYGIGALIITLPHRAEFDTNPPRKFDTLVLDKVDPDAETRYGFEAVVNRQVDNVSVAWTCYVRGKGA